MDQTVKSAAAGRWPARYTVVLLAAVAVFICYMDRVIISVAIIPMAADFDWSPEQQGRVLSSFFVGYLLTQVAGGWLAERYGGKIVLGFGVVFWSLFTLLTPIAAAGGMVALLVTRVLMGVGEGVTFPSIYALFGRWIPLAERSRAVGILFPFGFLRLRDGLVEPRERAVRTVDGFGRAGVVATCDREVPALVVHLDNCSRHARRKGASEEALQTVARR